MRFQDVIFSMFVLILVYLLVVYSKGAAAVLTSAFAGTAGLTKTLQGR